MAGFLNMAVKGVAAGVGLISEGIHHHKDRKLARCQSNESTNAAIRHAKDEAEREPILVEGDEEQWDLDDAQHELTNTQGAPSDTITLELGHINPTRITDAFLSRHLPPASHDTPMIAHGGSNSQVLNQLSPRLPLPVIIPQRRPKARQRGFVRAYAPDLALKNIDQETFLDFLETFDKASMASPWLDAINLAGFATIPLAPGVGVAVQLAIMISVKIAKDVQSRKR
jgi:hypothetical protein